MTLLLLLAVNLQQAPRALPRAFDDVPRGHWSYAAIEGLRPIGILTGYPNGYFTGRRTLTRYELVVAVDRALQKVLPQLRRRPRAARTPAQSRNALQATMLRLVREYEPELRGFGRDTAKIRRALTMKLLVPGTLKGPPPNQRARRIFPWPTTYVHYVPFLHKPIVRTELPSLDAALSDRLQGNHSIDPRLGHVTDRPR